MFAVFATHAPPDDAAGTLDDGTAVVVYPMMGSDDWRGDETLDPGWHIPSEFIHGTFDITS